MKLSWFGLIERGADLGNQRRFAVRLRLQLAEVEFAGVSLIELS